MAVPDEELYDALTGLPNRALMLDRAERMLARAARQSGLLAGALFIDIDWFEDVNEKLGPAAGDQLLKIVAERLENVVRAHDTVGRLGGDEFVIARRIGRARRAPGLPRPARDRGAAQARRARRLRPELLRSRRASASPSAATPPTSELLRDAQLALTAAKTAGKDRYTLFNANMRSVIEGRGVLEAELNTGPAGQASSSCSTSRSTTSPPARSSASRR